MDPQQRAIAQEFDGYRESYEKAVNDAISFSGQTVDAFVTAKANDLARQLAIHFGDTQRLTVLDVGCGIGAYHSYLKAKVGTLTGIDVSAACIDRARSANPGVHYDVYGGEVLPYSDASFDAAYCVCVMHHVPQANWAAFATELARVIKPGGLGVVYEHNPWHPLTRKAVCSCPFDRDAVLIAMPRMRALLEGAGFASVSTRSILTLPPRGRIWERIDTMFGMLPLGSQYRAIGRIKHRRSRLL